MNDRSVELPAAKKAVVKVPLVGLNRPPICPNTVEVLSVAFTEALNRTVAPITGVWLAGGEGGGGLVELLLPAGGGRAPVVLAVNR